MSVSWTYPSARIYTYICIIYMFCFFASHVQAPSARRPLCPRAQWIDRQRYQCLHSAHTHAVPWRSAQRRLNRFFCGHPPRRPNSSGLSLHASGTGGSSAHLQSLASRGTRDPMLRRRLRGDIPETHGLRLRNYIPWTHGLRRVICMLHCWDSWLWDGALKPEIFTTHVCLLCHDRKIHSTLN